MRYLRSYHVNGLEMEGGGGREPGYPKLTQLKNEFVPLPEQLEARISEGYLGYIERTRSSCCITLTRPPDRGHRHPRRE